MAANTMHNCRSCFTTPYQNDKGRRNMKNKGEVHKMIQKLFDLEREDQARALAWAIGYTSDQEFLSTRPNDVTRP